MFGISGAELLIILIVAILIVPVKNWPDVARWIARAVKSVRRVIGNINDKVDELKSQIDADASIDELVGKTTADITSAFAEPIVCKKRKPKK